MLEAGESCEVQRDPLECGAGRAFTIEIFNAANLGDIKSLGFFKVTKEMLECMMDNKIQVHF